MKKILAMILALALAVTAFACAAPAAEPAATEAPAAEAAATEAPTEAVVEEGFHPASEVTLNFPCIWVGTDSKAAVFGEMVAAFNDEYAGRAKVVIEEQTDYQAYRDKIRTMISAGQAPDLFSVDGTFKLADLADSGKLMDFAPYLDGTDWGATYTEGALSDATLDGKIYAIPFESAVFGIYYNSELLANAGYTEFPTTYDDMFAMADALKAQGVIAFPLMTGENAWTSMLWYSQILLAIGGPDVYKNGLDDPAFVQAADVLKKMFDYTSSDAVGAGAAVVNGHFLNFEAAVYTNGPWFLPRFAKEGINDLGSKVKFALPPEYTGGMGTYGGLAGTVQAYLCAGTQTDADKAAAVVEFYKFINQPEWLYQLAESSGAMFFVKLDSNPNDIQIKQDLLAAANSAPYIVKHFNDSMPTAVGNAFPAALDELVLGTVDAQGFVDLLKAAGE
ncbi:MAG: extracellular solute-binding protein [Clostridiales bacterium]|nr:extracellular solute-binding protein [Clostridiales bacterium]